MTDMRLVTALSSPSGFRFGEVSSLTAPRALSSSVPSLGPLAAFAGTFRGSGFNTIFRPDNKQTPTPLPVPVNGSDNVLELNLTQETLSFSPSLGSVPNRPPCPRSTAHHSAGVRAQDSHGAGSCSWLLCGAAAAPGRAPECRAETCMGHAET
jgi:hypothetical protein